MREIKFEYGFEGVNGIIKKVYYLSEIPRISHKCDVWNVLPLCYVRQYTGLKDKNGVEIYEGDIVNVSGKPYLTKNATVVFGKKSFGFKIKCLVNDGYKDLYKYYGLENSSKIEVIGNIHENN